MAEIADWQRKSYKKVQSFADGGSVLSESERIAQEGTRELSTIKDVKLEEKDKKEKKSAVAAPQMASGNIQMPMDKFQAPELGNQDDNKYSRILDAALSGVTKFRDGGYVKGKR